MNKHHMSDDRVKCKVVRNMHEKHNGLARVAPKGCRIGKRVLTKGGPIRKVDKKGNLKPDKRKFKVRRREFAVHAQMPDGTVEKFIWDTGATESSFNHVVAKKLGLLDADGNPTSKYSHKTANVGMADMSVHKGTLFRRVPLRIREAGNVASRGDVIVRKRASLLYGVTHMRGVRKHMKVKFAK